MHRLLISLVISGAVFAQQATRTIRFTRIEGPQNTNETATVIRSLGGIRELTVDVPGRSMTLSGAPWQLQLADWVTMRLDRAPADPGPTIERLDLPVETDSTIVAVRAARAKSALALQELATVIRSAARIRRGFVSTDQRMLFMRGTPSEIETAEWLFKELDQRTESHAVSDAWRMSNTEAGVVRIYYLHATPAASELIKDIAKLRTDAKVQWMFASPEYRALVVRGSEEEMTTADRFIRESPLFVGFSAAKTGKPDGRE